jgi:hypothetical protein
VYCSIDKIDLAARVEGRTIAVQTDDRSRAEIERAPELSVLFAMARVLNARAQLADDGHHDAPVHYRVTGAPEFLAEAVAAAGGTLDLAHKAAPAEARVSTLADRAFSQLARRAAARTGSRDLAIALRMLEDQTTAAPPDVDDEIAYWTRVLELAALAGELLRAKYPGRWVQTDRALVPFGFQLDTGSAVIFPTNRAQRMIEHGDESLFKLLIAADETVSHPTDTAHGRLMPSLRARRDVQLDEVVWKPVLADDVPSDLPVIVCGIDGESTFGMVRREALAKQPESAFAEAIANLAAESVQCERLVLGDLELALVTGSFYASEKLLDRALMTSLHEELDAEVLVAATPARGQLLVAAATHDPTALAQFAQLARRRHDEAGGRAISPALLLVTKGRVAGYVRGPGDRPCSSGQDGAPSEGRRPNDAAERPSARADTVPGVTKRAGILRRLFGRK